MAQFEHNSEQADDSTVSERVIMAVAAARNADPLELPPLYDAIDPDALNQLCGHEGSDGANGLNQIVFTLADCEVAVNGDGIVDVTAPTDQSPSASAVGPASEQEQAESLLD